MRFISSFIPLAAALAMLPAAGVRGETLNWNSSRGFGEAAPAGASLRAERASFPLPADTAFTITFYSEGRGNKSWEMTLKQSGGENLTLSAIPFRPDDTGLCESDGLRLVLTGEESGRAAGSAIIPGASAAGRFGIERRGANLRVKMSRGGKTHEHTFEYSGILRPDSLIISAPGYDVDGIRYETHSPRQGEQLYAPDLYELCRKIEECPDPICGVWTLFDRTLEENLLRLGGDYRVAVLPGAEPGVYDIVYLSGARVNAPAWLPGMRKGCLRRHEFDGIYSLTWIDSSFAPMSNGLTADTSESSTVLNISFPYQQSALRLRKTVPDIDN